MAGSFSNDSDQPISAINVTPFVDVVLVLLVIFMVTAPMVFKDSLKVTLPKAATTDGKVVSTLGVAITRSGNVLLNGKLVDRSEFERSVGEALAIEPLTQAIISADGKAMHEDVVRAMDWLKSAGLSRFAFQIERQER